MLMTVLIVFYVVTYFKQKLIFMGIVLFLGDLKKITFPFNVYIAKQMFYQC